MYRFLQLFKRDFLNLFFNPMWIFYSSAFPFLLVLILGFLNSGGYGNTITSYDYYGISMMIFSVLNTSSISANSFMEERIKKGNMRIIYSPLPKGYIYTSKIAASFVFSSFWHLIVIILLNLTLKVNYGGYNMGYIILLVLILEVFASILGVLFCCIFKSEGAANQFLSIVITIFGMLGGLFFRIDGFGPALEKISFVSPLKWIVTDIFKIIYDRDFSNYLSTVVMLIVLSLLTLLLCKIFYRTEDYV